MADFPRNQAGKSNDIDLTPLEVRQIDDQIKQELFQETNQDLVGDNRKSQKKQNKKRKIKEVVQEKEDVKKLKSSSIHSLSFQRLSNGMKLVGIVKDIQELEMTISLPNQLTGSVSITEISNYITEQVQKAANGGDESSSDDDNMEEDIEIPSLTDYYAIGQPILCCIVDLKEGSKSQGTRKRIELSMLPSKVNAGVEDYQEGMFLSGEIVSQEEHGFVLNMGSLKGFVPTSQVDSNDEMKVGKTVSCVLVKPSSGGLAVQVSCKKSSLQESVLSPSKNAALESLMPGTLVNARIKETYESGAIVSFASFYEGSIDTFHVGFPVKSAEDLDSRLKKGTKIKARILYIDSDEKKIGLSHKFELLSWDVISFGDVQVGTIYENVRISRVDQGMGVLATLPNVSLPAYIHISRLSDNHTAKIDKSFRLGSTHKGRVVGLDYCDGLVLISFEQKVLSQPFLRLQDIPVGSDIKGTILKVESFGVLVTVSDHIKGLCPKTHMSDVRLTHPERLFKAGATHKFRVLSVDAASKRLILTSKKSLMSSKYPVLTSYESATPGFISSGVISAVKPFGCIVIFYNEVRALVPLNELSSEHVTDPSGMFKVGQTVKCRIISVNASEKKMRASFKLSSPSKSARSSVPVGSIFSGTVLSKSDMSLIVESEDGQHACLLKNHVHDLPSISASLFASIKEGDLIENAIVWNNQSKENRLMISKQSRVIQMFKESDSVAWDTIKVGSLYPAIVKNITSTACFVEVAGAITAIATKHSLTDAFVASFEDHVQVGQYVMALVMQVDPSAQKLLVSLKASQVENEDTYQDQEISLLSTAFMSDGKGAYTIGQQVTGKVDKLMPFGFIVSLEDGNTSGVVTRNNQSQKFKVQVGDAIKARVLDINSESGILDLMISSEDNKVKKVSSKLEQLKKSGKNVDAVVQMIKPDYAILTIPSLGNTVVYALSRNMNSLPGKMARFRSDTTIPVRIKDILGKNTLERILVFPVRVDNQKILSTNRALNNAIDAQLSSLEEIKLGQVIKGRIQSVKATQINVHLADNLKGRIHASYAFDDFSTIGTHESTVAAPLKHFHPNQMIEAKVVGFHDAKSHAYLPFSHRNPLSKTVVELSIRPQDLSLPAFELASSKPAETIDDVDVGKKYLGFVQAVEATCLWVQISPVLLGRVDQVAVSTNMSVVQSMEENFKVGMAVEAYILRKNKDKKTLDLSFISPETVKEGTKVIARVNKMDPLRGLLVSLPSAYSGRIALSDLNDEFSESPLSAFSNGQLVEAYILRVNHDRNQVTLSLRQSLLTGASTPLVAKELKVGQVLPAYVKQMNEKGCFVELSADIVARVKISQLSDKFIKDFSSIFALGSPVKGKILSVDSISSQIEMTLKGSQVDPENNVHPELKALKKGMKQAGRVKKIESFGLFVEMEGPVSTTGLCHISQVADVPVTDLNSLYAVGDLVKVLVLKVDQSKGRVSLGMKPSYFEDEESEADSEENVSENEDHMEVDGEDEIDKDVTQTEEDDEEDTLVHDTLEEENDEDEEIEDVEEDVAPTSASLQPFIQSLSVEGFSWVEDDNATSANSGILSDIDESDDDNDSTNDPKQKSRRAKKRAKKEEEERIARAEQALVDGDHPPESAQDYEKLLLGSPNNSYLWIRFMAYELQLAEIEQARQVAERALRTIHFREEQERFNVWVAYLNLENSFGTADSLQKVFERATQMAEAKKVYMQMCMIYEKAEKMEKAAEMHEKTCKKFKGSCKVWVAHSLFLFKTGKTEQARSLLQRSLQSLPNRKHIKMTKKFAQIEFKHGDSERARTIFEGLMSRYPKRVDLWSIYLDLEIKNGSVDATRRLFDRVIQRKWSTKKMKFFFKKYLQFEKQFGTPDGVDAVKQAAMDYVATINNS